MINADDKIQKGIIKLILVKPLYGITLSYLKRIECKEDSKLHVPTMGVDGIHLYYNKQWIEGLSELNLVFILAHEAYHILSGHCDPQYRRRFFVDTFDELMNVAMDYEANAFLVEQEKNEVLFELPKDALYSTTYNSRKWPAERIYEELKKAVKQSIKDTQSSSGSKSKTGSNGKDTQSSSGSKSKTGSNGKDGAEKKNKFDRGENADVHLTYEDAMNNNFSFKDLHELQQEIRERIQSAIQQASAHGSLPGELKRRFEEVLYSKKDWRQELLEYLQFDKVDYSFSPCDRRFLWQDMAIPDLNEKEKIEIVIAVDTSGSITNKIFNSFISEIRGIFNAISHVSCSLISCDAKVHDVFNIEDEDKLASIDFKGGGGTDFRPIFDHIETMQTTPSLIIYFTDGEGIYPKSSNYDTLWCIYNNQRYDSKVPFGRVIHIEETV